MGHFVYKYVHNGEIVYIGKNDTDLSSRIYQHTKEQQFKQYNDCDIYYCTLANSTMSDVVESELIRRYKPILNVAKISDWDGLDFVEPKWTKFEGTPKAKQFTSKKQISKQEIIKQERKRKVDIMLGIISRCFDFWEENGYPDFIKSYETLFGIEYEQYLIRVPFDISEYEHEDLIPLGCYVDTNILNGGFSVFSLSFKGNELFFVVNEGYANGTSFNEGTKNDDFSKFFKQARITNWFELLKFTIVNNMQNGGK